MAFQEGGPPDGDGKTLVQTPVFSGYASVAVIVEIEVGRMVIVATEGDMGTDL